MIRNQKGEHRSRTIPVRFLDEENEKGSEPEARKAANEEDASSEGREPSAEDIGRESSYEGETEVKRRIDRGEEDDTATGRGRADESDTAGGPPPGEMPEHRED